MTALLARPMDPSRPRLEKPITFIFQGLSFRGLPFHDTWVMCLGGTGPVRAMYVWYRTPSLGDRSRPAAGQVSAPLPAVNTPV